MAKAILSLEQAAAFVGRMKAVAEGGGSFSDIIMPNGKKLADCTFSYVGQVWEAMQTMGVLMPEPVIPRCTPSISQSSATQSMLSRCR